ncbi:hypothetical protein [Halarcobacter bivalviorum]|uniref:Flagellar FliJ protein n=1 Tax=Halarcobacter bivalviorum TaxID=663364 RepID=A0AAX2A8S2_9BACT|nr:hypothetical protein [Halarcobacter bivalviorum]AXH13354.1 hypothetical protein ABIV_2380 [Halarcobacter bivalviorum]RXK10042.1 hypothetical protein CRV05_06600 [Halarcobacter bivalviorum]
MIDKLYNLKKTQTDQKLMQRAQLQAKINHIDAEIMLTQTQINTASVQKFGAISDFSVLAMHKNTMKEHIRKLENEKIGLIRQMEVIIEEIIQLQKETEQFEYILDELKQEKQLKIIKAEMEASEEYIQSKYISG